MGKLVKVFKELLRKPIQLATKRNQKQRWCAKNFLE